MKIRAFVLLTILVGSFTVAKGQTAAPANGQKTITKPGSTCEPQAFSGPTRQSKLPQYGGCECYLQTLPDKPYIQITPNPVTTTVGTATYLQFDGSQMCQGQSTRNFKGTVQWEQLNTDDLTDSYGVMCHVYSTGGAQKVKFNFSVDCYDDGPKSCSKTCTASGEVSVKVLPLAKNEKLKD